MAPTEISGMTATTETSEMTATTEDSGLTGTARIADRDPRVASTVVPDLTETVRIVDRDLRAVSIADRDPRETEIRDLIKMTGAEAVLLAETTEGMPVRTIETEARVAMTEVTVPLLTVEMQ